MTASIVEVIQHYQRSIDNSQDNEDRLLYCIRKLYKLPIKVEHLQETGVGKTVNSLRKYNGEIGVAAKTLVTKWKAMVAAEEEPIDKTPHSNDNEKHDNHYNEPSPQNSDGNERSGDEELRNLNPSAALEQEKTSENLLKHQNDRKQHSHKECSSKPSSLSKHSEDKQKKPSTSSSNDKDHHHHKTSQAIKGRSSKEREKERPEHKSRDKHKDREEERHKHRSEKHKEEKYKSDKESIHDTIWYNNNGSNKAKVKRDERALSSSKGKSYRDKERTSKRKNSSKDKEKAKGEKSLMSSKNKHETKSSKDNSEPPSDRKRRNTTSDTESNEFKSPQPKVAKVKRSTENTPPQDEEEDNSFDSSMGANFGDILGMLNAPAKKSKKYIKSSLSGGISKDMPRPSTSNSTPAKVSDHKTSPAIYTPHIVSNLSTAKPDLLAPTAKLEPLDPSIALELPTISTNYKPMPLNQTVMDCVFNTSSSSSSKPVRSLTDDEAYQHGISSKTMRTKIYSGVKTGQALQVPTLFDLCIRILQKNIDALEYTGGVPFEVLRPVLERATPQQLFIFEDYNPYLMEDSDVLWQTHVQRNYRTQKRMENESWREMFLRCQEEEDRRLSVLKNSIKHSQKIAAAPIRKTQLAFIDTMVKPPRNVMRKQEQFGTKSKLVATPASRVASLQIVTPNAAKTGDQRLKIAPSVRDHAQVASSSIRPKKAPLMQKTLAFMRGRLKR